MSRRLLAEVRRWRVTWVGVVIAGVLPMAYLAVGSPKHALVALTAGVGIALSARTLFDDRDDAASTPGSQ